MLISTQVLEKIVDFEQSREKRLRPFNNPRQCMLAPASSKPRGDGVGESSYIHRRRDRARRFHSRYVARRLAPRPKAKFTKDAAAGNTNKPLFDIFRKPQKRQRTDDDDEVEVV